MGVETQRYIRKPLYVDAVRITSQNFKEIAAWCEGKIQTGEVPPGSGKNKTYIKVNVIKPMNVRQTMAFVGDWLLRQNGNFKIYTHKAFKLAFNEATAEVPEPVSEPDVHETKTQEKKDDLPPQPRRVGANINIRDDRPKEETPEMKEARETIEAEGGSVEEAAPEAIADAVRENEQARAATELAEEGIAEMVGEQQPVELPPPDEIIPDAPVVEEVPNSEGIEVENSPTAPPVEEDEDRPIAEETPKRVLSEHEQRILGPDEVRNMVRSGEVILAQDLAEETA